MSADRVKGPHKAVVADGKIVGCEFCGSPPPFPDGGCGGNMISAQGMLYPFLSLSFSSFYMLSSSSFHPLFDFIFLFNSLPILSLLDFSFPSIYL